MHVVKSTSGERGDTLIEVLVAMTVLAVVIVGAFSLMNKGVAQMYDSMERTEVRLLLDSQIEFLTYARDQYVGEYTDSPSAVWATLRTSIGDAPGVPATTSACGSTPLNAFWLTNDAGGMHVINTGLVVTQDGFPSPGKGIWIQKISGNGSAPGAPSYRDFYVRACWRQNSNPQTQVLSTVVRLYDL